MTPTLPPSSVTKVCSTPTPGSLTRRTSTMPAPHLGDLRTPQSYVRAVTPSGCRPEGPSAAVVGRDDDLDALELLEIGVARGRHRAAQRAHQVHSAVGLGRRTEQDLLERGDSADLDARAARELRM